MASIFCLQMIALLMKVKTFPDPGKDLIKTKVITLFRDFELYLISISYIGKHKNQRSQIMNTTKTQLVCLMILSLLISSCGRGIRDHDGNSYKLVKIGNQSWMVENLNVSHFRNGDEIPEAKSPEEWITLGREGKPAWCSMQNDRENDKKYGKLYNWYAVNDPGGLAPKGSHVASDDEWTQLTNFLGGGVIAALQMRTIGFTNKTDQTNQSGFKGLPGGYRTNNGSFYGLSSFGYWWTTTEFSGSHAWIRLLNYIECDINSLGYEKSNGLSVRCLMN
jgi:uncharacterized protein (TIGR02145 family)